MGPDGFCPAPTLTISAWLNAQVAVKSFPTDAVLPRQFGFAFSSCSTSPEFVELRRGKTATATLVLASRFCLELHPKRPPSHRSPDDLPRKGEQRSGRSRSEFSDLRSDQGHSAFEHFASQKAIHAPKTTAEIFGSESMLRCTPGFVGKMSPSLAGLE